ncbi:MAG: GNAT family N-acetyltransferase [Bacteroides sp.]|nr:GNAT family N-acetyltransferase [Bacteroides sp.]
MENNNNSMTETIYRISDIPTLIKLRIDFISQDKELSDSERKQLSLHLQKYFQEPERTEDLYAYGMNVGGNIASTAFLSINQCPPGLSFLDGRFGIIMNVLTYPEYRGKGYATSVFNYLINEAKKLSIHVLDLNATDMGKGLYEKAGFKEIPYTAMRMKL